ncbi:MAG: AgmX/PglI C-terminal domain-containing protein [bacterium]
MNPSDRRSILPLSGKDEPSSLPSTKPPGGLEEVLAMAAADDDFARALLDRREEALLASGLPISPAARAVLTSVSDTALAQMIESLDGALESAERRDALSRLATAALAALGSGLVLGAAGCKKRPAPPGKAPPTAKPGDRPETMEPLPAPTPMAGRPLPTTDAMKGPEPMFGNWGADPGRGGTGVRPDRPALGAKRPRVILSHTESSGDIDPATVRRTLRRTRAHLEHCYLSVGLPHKPKLQGSVRAAFVISPSGKVKTVTLHDSTLDSKPLEECIRAAIRRRMFPMAGDGKPTKASVTLRFTQK